MPSSSRPSATCLEPGQTRAYRPGVIHSTAHPHGALVIRVTGTDLNAIPRYHFRPKKDKIPAIRYGLKRLRCAGSAQANRRWAAGLIMKIVIPDDYQDMVDRLACFELIRHHEVTRYREPARDLDHLVERLREADVVVSIRERVAFSRALIARLPKLALIALVGRLRAGSICRLHRAGIMVSTGSSNSPDAPAELTVAMILASRRNVALEAERMRHGDWPCTLSHRLRGSTLGIFGLGAIGQLVAAAGQGLGMNILAWGRPSTIERRAAAGYAAPATRRICSSARTCCRCMCA